jgi:hypothetical protein
MVCDEDFIPGEEEGISNERMLQIKRWNDENGDNIEDYKQMVKQSLSAIWNLRQIRDSYYIHSTRKASALACKVPIIKHEDVMTYLKGLYPKGEFSSKNSQEFRELYDQINNLVELEDFDDLKIKRMLKDPN